MLSITQKIVSACLAGLMIFSIVGVAGCGRDKGTPEGPKISLAEGMGDAAVGEFGASLSAEATDSEGRPLPASAVTWTSDIDGELGSGAELDLDRLTPGVHTITVRAVDAEGKVTTRSFRLTVERATGMVPRGGDYYGRNFHDSEFYWAAVTVRDQSGNNVTDLPLSAFSVIERLVGPDGETAAGPYPVAINLEKEHPWEPQWFWEESLSREKIDVVFLVEGRGTMEEGMPAIRSEAHKLVDRLVSSHLDFRLAAVDVEETPTIGGYFGFYGPGELDRIREGIDSLFSTGGTWWNPVAIYDCLLWTPALGFREDARKVVIILADIQPQTIYDTFWYAPECSAATLSAVERFLADHPDIEVYYSLNPEDPVDYEQFFDPERNPMAGPGLDERGRGSGLQALEELGLARSISWPFRAEDIPLEGAQVADSKYYFIWEGNFPWEDWDLASGSPVDYHVEVEISAAIPDGRRLSATIVYPAVKEYGTLSVRYRDERGRDFPDGWAVPYLDYRVGHRALNISDYFDDVGGRWEMEYPTGTYLLTSADHSWAEFDYETLRARQMQEIEIPPEGLSLDITLPLAEREMWLDLAGGLLDDLDDNWQQPGNPFSAFVAEARGWLSELDREGIGLEEMVRLRRFVVGLSPYPALSEYAQQEIEKATENVEEIVEDVAAVIAAIEELAEATEFDWEDAMGVIAEIAYDILTAGEFSAAKAAIEQGITRLLEYAAGELLDEMKEIVCEELPESDAGRVICTLVDVASKLPSAADSGDWSAILDPLEELAFDLALEEAREYLAEGLVDEAFSGLDLPDPIERDISGLVEEVLLSLTSGEGFSGFDQVLSNFARGVVEHLGAEYYAQNRARVVEAIGSLFDALRDSIEDELGPGEASAFVGGFLLGMAEDLMVAALPRVGDDGSIDYGPDGDAFTHVLIKHTLYHLVLEDYFVDEAVRGLEETLELARSFSPEGSVSDWETAMGEAFWDLRGAAGDLSDGAWDALGEEEAVSDWAEGLEGLVAILEPLGEALDFMATIYPPLEDTADAVHGFVAALDAVQVVPEAIELGLRIGSLDDLGDGAEHLGALAMSPGWEE